MIAGVQDKGQGEFSKGQDWGFLQCLFQLLEGLVARWCSLPMFGTYSAVVLFAAADQLSIEQ